MFRVIVAYESRRYRSWSISLGSVGGILEMNVLGDKLVRDIFLEKDLLEDITSFFVYNLDIMLETGSCECVQ